MRSKPVAQLLIDSEVKHYAFTNANKSNSKKLMQITYTAKFTIEPDKRDGKPCIRQMRITVYDVLGWLAAGMSHAEILDHFPELTEEDIRACLEFAADRKHRLVASVGIV